MASKNIYQQEVRHNGLGKYQIVKAETPYELTEKVKELQLRWDRQWKTIEEKNEKIERINRSINKAELENFKAVTLHNKLNTILIDNLYPSDLDFNALKDHSVFQKPMPQPVSLYTIPQEPKRTDAIYNPSPSFFTKLFSKKLEAFNAYCDEVFERYHSYWVKDKEIKERQNQELIAKYEKDKQLWESDKADFERKQQKTNQDIDLFMNGYAEGNPSAIERYFKLILKGIYTPLPNYKCLSDIEYCPNNKTLIIDVTLPSIEIIPKLKSVKFIKSQNLNKETYYTESYIKDKYDSILYQLVLLILHDVFTLSENCNTIDAVTVNGKVHTIDRGTGNSICPYILSLHTTRTVFQDINLERVDPKTCFKKLKGISASALADLAPIAPIMNISHEDKRFINGYNVLGSISNDINLATIDWKDFENLIRDIFEEEFSSNGSEVKITQASRDGGVDAIAFDNDPIRGGKIIIQAKRYTNTVSVSAVRDLYGTVVNEGAMKGILVTTSDYGSDSYSFAKDKPITLLNGNNLLSLLEKHGHKARINIKEAKEMKN